MAVVIELKPVLQVPDDPRFVGLDRVDALEEQGELVFVCRHGLFRGYLA